MIKGAQKQLIVVRTVNSPYFDEAYFVLRRELKDRRPAHTDMLTEANRILEESDPTPRLRGKRSARSVLLFLAGTLCGGLGAVLVCVFLL